MGHKHVFVVITAGNCGFCSSFKTTVWPELKPKLVKSDLLHIVEISLNKMEDFYSADISQKYPSDLSRFVKGFPTFLLCTYESWNSGGSLIAEVFNTKMVYSDVTGQEEIEDLEREYLQDANTRNITQWLSDHIQSNKFMSNKPGTSSSSLDKPQIVLTDSRKPNTIFDRNKNDKFRVRYL